MEIETAYLIESRRVSYPATLRKGMALSMLYLIFARC